MKIACKKSIPADLCIFFALFLVTLCCSRDHRPESEAARFDRVAKTVFKEVYPSLAEQIVEDYGIAEGTCLDIGCGPAYLSIELARRSRLRIIGVDLDLENIEIARANVRAARLEDRIRVEQGDAQDLRFSDGEVDLVVSRGSFLFWDDQVLAFREIYRVLKPGGVAFVGGGMGRKITPEKKEAIKRKLSESGMMKSCQKNMTRFMMEEVLNLANIMNYRILGDGAGDSGCRCGMWVEIRK